MGNFESSNMLLKKLEQTCFFVGTCNKFVLFLRRVARHSTDKIFARFKYLSGSLHQVFL